MLIKKWTLRLCMTDSWWDGKTQLSFFDMFNQSGPTANRLTSSSFPALPLDALKCESASTDWAVCHLHEYIRMVWTGSSLLCCCISSALNTLSEPKAVIWHPDFYSLFSRPCTIQTFKKSTLVGLLMFHKVPNIWGDVLGQQTGQFSTFFFFFFAVWPNWEKKKTFPGKVNLRLG